MTANVWTRNLHDKLQAYKAGLSKEEIAELVDAYEGTGNISVRAIRRRKSWRRFLLLKREDISRRDRTDL